MIRWVVFLFLVASLAGACGFSGIAATAGFVAKVLFFLFLILCTASLVFGSSRGT